MRDEVRELISGSVGGIASTFAGHPLDTVKTRLQVYPTLYRNGFHCFAKVFKKEGALGVYKGVLPPVAAQGLMNAVLFATEGFSRRMLKNAKMAEWKKVWLSGMIAGGVVAFIDTPFDLVKTQLQNTCMAKPNSIEAKFNTFEMTGHIYRQNGLKSLYQGLQATLARNIPSYGLFFAVHYSTVSILTEKYNLGATAQLIGGGIAGSAAWGFCFPFDIVKTRMQSDSINKSERQYKNMKGCIQKTMKNNSLGELSQGLGPCLLRGFFVCAILFVVQNRVDDMLKNDFLYRRNDGHIEKF